MKENNYGKVKIEIPEEIKNNYKNIIEKAKEGTFYIKPQPMDIIFYTANREVIRLCSNGDIHVKGKLIENDIEVVEGMKELVYGNKKSDR